MDSRYVIGGRVFLVVGAAVLMGLFLNYLHLSKKEFPQTQEKYWEETGINELHLLQYLNDDYCRQSPQRFFACANILGTMAYQVGYQFLPDKGFRRYNRSIELSSEKQRLAPWIEYLDLPSEEEQNIKMATFSFERYWRILRQQIPARKRSLVLGLGINSYFSIMNDPHTYLVPADYYEEVIAKADATTLQTGIWLTKIGARVFIKKVADNSPISLAQLKKGDEVISINGRLLSKLSLPQVYDLFKGPLGKTIIVDYKRGARSVPKSTLVTRTEYVLPSIQSKVLKAEKDVGYIELSKFSVGVCEQFQRELETLKERQIGGLILDLRDNPGGQLEEAACIGSLFLGKRKIFELQYLDRSGPPEEVVGKSEATYLGPITVLINSGTASAAEVLAGALQDYRRGILIGGLTFGKGSFQEGDYWDSNGKLILFETKGLFLLPSGRSPQAQGLSPDLALPQDFVEEREVKLYLNPLKAQATAGSPSLTIEIMTKKCGEGEFRSNLQGERLTGDNEIAQAKRVLSCKALQVGGI